MSPLVIFLCDNEFDLRIIVESTNKESYHRMFVLSNSALKSNVLFDKNDSILIWDYRDYDVNIICRFVSLYSNPQYSHLILYFKKFENILNDLQNLNLKDYIEQNNCIGFSRFFVSINGFNFKFNEQKNYNELEYYEKINKCFEGEPVEHLFFLEALKELLPECKYENLDNLPKDEIDLIRLFNSKNKNSTSIYYILKENTSDDIKNKIVLTSSEVEKYKYKIKREDGFILYII